jgi:phosphate uptake regulator
MKRKVIKQGHNTLTITLPSGWANKHQIRPGDELELESNGKTLVLRTEKLLDTGKKTKDISKLTSILPLVLLSLYRKGYDDVELKFDKPQASIIIENILQNKHIGYHIFEQTKNSCLLKALSDINNLEFDDILRKLFILLKMKLDLISEAIAKEDLSELYSVIAMDAAPVKITNFCHRIISKGNLKETELIYHLQNIVTNLENLDSQLNLIASIMIYSSSRLKSKKLPQIIHDFKDLYSDFYTAYYNDNLDDFVSVMNRKSILLENINISDRLNLDDHRLFLGLNNSFIYFNSILLTAFMMRL